MSFVRRQWRAFGAWIDSPRGGFAWNTAWAAINVAFATDGTGLPPWPNAAAATLFGLLAIRCAVQEQTAQPVHLQFKTINGLPLSGDAGEGR